jgi:hypothetical protein
MAVGEADLALDRALEVRMVVGALALAPAPAPGQTLEAPTEAGVAALVQTREDLTAHGVLGPGRTQEDQALVAPTEVGATALPQAR